jgi:hypothetical protein
MKVRGIRGDLRIRDRVRDSTFAREKLDGKGLEKREVRLLALSSGLFSRSKESA